MKVLQVIGLAASYISATQAHGMFSTLFIDGESQGDGKCLRTSFTVDTITSPITDLDSAEMACGVVGQMPAKDTCAVKPGARLSFEFRLWASGSPPGTIDASHYGPMAIYAKQVDNAADAEATGAGWFKLWEYGYDETEQTWATQKLIANDGIVSLRIPASMPKGEYLIRPEIIALHNLADGPAQFYIGCAQVSVVGEGRSRVPPLELPEDEVVSIPGYIKASDPAVNFNSHPDAVKHFPYPLGGPKVHEFTDARDIVRVAFGPLHGAVPDDEGGDSAVTSSTTDVVATSASTPATTGMKSAPTMSTGDSASAMPSSSVPSVIPTCRPRPKGGNNKGLAISGDGSCGASSGFTCLGSVYGDCCSAKGWCGSTPEYCRTGCQGQFGACQRQ